MARTDFVPPRSDAPSSVRKPLVLARIAWLSRTIRRRGVAGGEADNHPTSGTVRSSRISRLLDRYVGQALLRIIGLVRRPRQRPAQPQHIAFCVLGAIGDTIVASGIMEDTRRAYPDARITLVTSSTNRSSAALLPAVDDVLVLPINRPDLALRATRAAGFDLFIDCNQWLRISSFFALAAGCFTVGFCTAGQGRHYAYDQTADHLPTRHELENYRALMQQLGIDTLGLPRVSISHSAREFVKALLNSLGLVNRLTRTVVFHPWAGGSNARLKEWPTGHWIELAAALQEKGLRIYVTGAPGDITKTEHLIAAASANGVTIISLAGKLNLCQLAALLDVADVFVSVNTGVMHLGAALGTSLVALHGPTNPLRWGPVGPADRSVIMVPEGVTCGYLHLGYEFPRNAAEIMHAIPVKRVLEAVMRLLDGKDVNLSSAVNMDVESSLSLKIMKPRQIAR